VLSDPSLIEKELDDRVIKKRAELDRALVDVLDDAVEIPGLRLDLVEKVWPVLIVPSTVIQSDFPWSYRGKGTRPVHAPSRPPAGDAAQHQDIERALAAVETGAGLPAILGSRMARSIAGCRRPISSSASSRAEHRPVYLDEQLRLVGDEVLAALSLDGPI
jgi:hypothetical protein